MQPVRSPTGVILHKGDEMPAKSQAQRQAAAIAKYHPKDLHKNNKDLLKMTGVQLHEFADTPEKGLPKKTKKGGK